MDAVADPARSSRLRDRPRDPHPRDRPRDRQAMMLAAAAVLGLAILVIAGAFAFQFAGYPPCELCLKERLPYYAGIAVAAATLGLARFAPRPLAASGFAALTILFLGSTGFGVYHAGVEWGFWPGPAGCSGPLTTARNNADFLRQLQGFHAVRCDAVAIRISGLSLAGWNAVASLGLAALSLAGLVAGRR